jgi:hypothetical protein
VLGLHAQVAVAVQGPEDARRQRHTPHAEMDQRIDIR